MKEILVSKSRPCFCNSNKKFKVCCGVNLNNLVEDSYKIHFFLKDVYEKSYVFLKRTYGDDFGDFVEHFKRFNSISEDKFSKQMETSFKFIEFLLFRAKDKHGEFLSQKILNSNILLEKEKDFLKDLVEKSFFSIFRIIEVKEKDYFVKIEDIFSNCTYEFHNKIIFSNLEEGGLLYARFFDIFGRFGILPTFMMKKANSIKIEDLEKVSDSFKKRFETLKKEDSKLTFESFIDSIEYEIYGGDDPYQVYEFDDRYEEFKKKYPTKSFDDFLDEIEEEMLK